MWVHSDVFCNYDAALNIFKAYTVIYFISFIQKTLMELKKHFLNL